MLILKGHTNSIQALAYTPDGGTLVSAGDDCTIRLWDVRSGTETGTLTAHTAGILTLAISPDGTTLASGGFDKRVHIWDLPSRELRHSYTHAPDPHYVTAVCFSPDGEWLASGGEGYSGVRLQPHHGERRPTHRPRVVEPGRVWSLAFSPDSAVLAIGQGNGTVLRYHLDDRFDPAGFAHPAGINALAYRPDGRMLATLAGRTVRLWDLKTGRPRALPDHAGHAWTLAFTPDGRYLATGGWDSTVRLWDPTTGRETARFDWQLGRINAVAFAPDGMTAAAAGNAHEIVIWDVDEF